MPVSKSSTVDTSPLFQSRDSGSIARALHRLSPALARAASETAEAFFPAREACLPDLAAPRISGNRPLHCSQANIGERYEMVCGLSVDGKSWTSLFPAGTGEDMGADVLGELVNCICGSLLSDQGFLEEFGQMFPCVPSLDHGPVHPETPSLNGAVRVSGTWIHFTFAIKERTDVFSRSGRLAAAA